MNFSLGCRKLFYQKKTVTFFYFVNSLLNDKLKISCPESV